MFISRSAAGQYFVCGTSGHKINGFQTIVSCVSSPVVPLEIAPLASMIARRHRQPPRRRRQQARCILGRADQMAADVGSCINSYRAGTTIDEDIGETTHQIRIKRVSCAAVIENLEIFNVCGGEAVRGCYRTRNRHTQRICAVTIVEAVASSQRIAAELLDTAENVSLLEPVVKAAPVSRPVVRTTFSPGTEAAALL